MIPLFRSSDPDPDFGLVEPGVPVRATWWRRFGATLIDISAAWLVATIAGVLGVTVATIAWMCFVAWNNILLTGTTGFSLGRQAMGYQVLDDQLFEPIGPGRATGRFFASFIDASLVGLGFLLPLFSQDRQRVADMVVHAGVFDVNMLDDRSRKMRTVLALVVGGIVAVVVPMRLTAGGYGALDRASEVSRATSAASAASLRSAAYLADPSSFGLPDGVKLTDVTLWQRWVADAPSQPTVSEDLRVTLFSSSQQTHPGWSGEPVPFAPVDLPDVARVEFRIGKHGVTCLQLIPGTDAAGLLLNKVSQEACGV
jgi:uncharacterized RDD family membrane protein YckC